MNPKQDEQPAKPSQLHTYYYFTRGTRPGDPKAKHRVWTHCFVHDGAGRYAKGSARCAPDDNIDPEYGKRLAYKRALHGYYTQQCVQGQTPEGSSMYKVMAGHPLSELEAKFLALSAGK